MKKISLFLIIISLSVNSIAQNDMSYWIDPLTRGLSKPKPVSEDSIYNFLNQALTYSFESWRYCKDNTLENSKRLYYLESEPFSQKETIKEFNAYDLMIQGYYGQILDTAKVLADSMRLGSYSTKHYRKQDVMPHLAFRQLIQAYTDTLSPPVIKGWDCSKLRGSLLCGRFEVISRLFPEDYNRAESDKLQKDKSADWHKGYEEGQKPSFGRIYKISVPVFDSTYTYAIMSIEKKRNGISFLDAVHEISTVTFIYKRINGVWTTVAFFDSFGFMRCKKRPSDPEYF